MGEVARKGFLLQHHPPLVASLSICHQAPAFFGDGISRAFDQREQFGYMAHRTYEVVRFHPCSMHHLICSPES